MYVLCIKDSLRQAAQAAAAATGLSGLRGEQTTYTLYYIHRDSLGGLYLGPPSL